MSELNPGEALFKQYGKSFQEKIFQGLLSDHTWAAQMTEVMLPTYFDLRYLAYLSDKYFKHHVKYKTFPTMALLISIIKDELKEQNNAVLKEQIVEYLGRMRASPDMGDIAYVKDRALDFCRKQALREALEKSVELISGDKYDAVVDLMRKAVSVGLPVSVGHDFFEDMEARFVKISRLACPTGLEQLDQKTILNGGLGKGELGVIVANTGVGKCTTGDATITIRHPEVTIDGTRYKPWDRLTTEHGSIFARDVIEADKISYSDCTRQIKIGDLFLELGLSVDSECETISIWPIEALSFDGFYQIEGFRTTEPLDTLVLQTDDNDSLEAAYDHIMLAGEDRGWQKLKDLSVGDCVVSHNRSPKITSIVQGKQRQTLFDLQVAICHSYMTNDMLSHNSHFLVSLGSHALKVGKNVVHYTLELSETAVGIRYDSHLTGIASNDIQDSKQEVLEQYKSAELGRLIIKEYPTGGATVNTIRNHLEKLALRGFIPHMIIIDYADIMRSSREYDALRLELKLIYEELRNLAMERSIPLWTASQANRDSSNSDVVGLENMSESYGKAMVADVVLSLSRKPTEKATGAGRLFVAKNRAGRDGILFPVHIDTARSTIKILEENELTLQEAITQDDGDRKKLINEKWKQVMGAK